MSGKMVKATFWSVLLASALGICSMLVITQKLSGQEPTPAPDNTKVNKRDQSKTEPTADQQKENPSDRDITRRIRRAVMKDKSLSTYAHNVKIITQDGMVTLKGPVRSEKEKQAIEAKAKKVAGEDKVTSELEVMPGT
ncbi:MAG TPA: BON domain-containing protein [Terriglobia bacterium]|nr:BON domain-containing protein [Terriglobia bacterium]